MNEVCSLELLRSAVMNRLSPDEEQALHNHLAQCEACCVQLEQLAGGEVWQREAATFLATDELDATFAEVTRTSELDFSVEHLDPSDDPHSLGQLGGYDVIAIVGSGGMGVVLKAFDRELKRYVAIKMLAPHLAHSSVARQRFAREAQAAAAVVNPHVIPIHHVQPTGRLPFLIMPLLTGESLAQRLKARGPLELTEVLRIGMQAAEGLAAAHDQGLVHRDVKPANIFVEKGVERVVITDFGLARAADDMSLTRQGVVAGTPEYMSPEQARGDTLDARSDLFSLGCVLYEMATGVSPFRADSLIATMRRLVDDSPQAMDVINPELPPWFIGIVDRLLQKDPAQRFSSAKEVCDLLESCLAHLHHPAAAPLPMIVPPSSSALNKPSRFSRTGILLMTGAMFLALVGALFCYFSDPPLTPDEVRLQGIWEVVAFEERGIEQPESAYKDVKLRLEVSDRTLTIMTTAPDGKAVGGQKMTFVVNDKTSPKEIDFSIPGRKALGIFVLEKDTLKLCLDTDGNTRPDGFKTQRGTQQRSYLLKKAVDPPRTSTPNIGSDPKSPSNTTPPDDVQKDAEKLLEWALRQAKDSKKRVMLVVGTKSCVPCRQLDGLFEETKPILDKYLVIVKLDLAIRNGDEVHDRLRKVDLDGGNAFLPWMIILNDTGEVLSKSGKQTIGDKDAITGLPQGKEEDRRYFIEMLRKSCPGITDNELSEIYTAATALHRRIWGEKGSYSDGK